MGQRLTITFLESNGEPVATLYQHWSGYTFEALDVASNIGKVLIRNGILGEIYPHKRKKILMDCLIDNYYPNITKGELTGASSWDKYMNKATKMAHYNTLIADELPIKRNAGLVDIDPHAMQRAQDIAVINMTVDLDYLTFDPRSLLSEVYPDTWYDEEETYRHAFKHAPILYPLLYSLDDLTSYVEMVAMTRYFRVAGDNETLYEVIGD